MARLSSGVGEFQWRMHMRLNRGSFRSAKRGIRLIASEAEAAESRTRTLNMALRGVAISLSAVTMIRGVRGLISTIAEFQRLEGVLQTVEGSTEAAAAAQATIEGMATTLPFTVQQLTNAWIRLRGAGLEPNVAMFHELGNVAATFGASIEDLVAAAQNAARGMPRALEGILRTDISAQRGSALDIVMEGQTESIERNMDSVLGFLRELGSDRYAGGVERQMNTIGGAFSNMAVAFELFAKDIGEAGFAQGLNDFIKALTGATAEGQNLADVIGRVLGEAFSSLAGIVTFLQDNTEMLTASMGVMIAFTIPAMVDGILGLTRKIVAIRLASLTAFTGLVLIGLAIDDIYAFAQGRPSVLQAMIGDEAEAERLRGELVHVNSIMDTLRGTLREIPGQLNIVGNWIGDTLFAAVQAGANVLPTVMEKLWDVARMFARWLDAIISPWTGMLNLLLATLDRIPGVNVGRVGRLSNQAGLGEANPWGEGGFMNLRAGSSGGASYGEVLQGIGRIRGNVATDAAQGRYVTNDTEMLNNMLGQFASTNMRQGASFGDAFLQAQEMVQSTMGAPGATFNSQVDVTVNVEGDPESIANAAGDALLTAIQESVNNVPANIKLPAGSAGGS